MARTVKTTFADLPTIYNIDGSVGPNAANFFVDVLLVQTLMKMANFVRGVGGMPVESSRNITVDGIVGPQTIRMIKAFEADVKSSRLLLVDDGVFEPSRGDGFTRSGTLFKIIHLNRRAKNQSPFGNDYNALPFAPTTNFALRMALANGATRPSSSPPGV